ncbi:MAG TPA: 2,3-epoxybenzoyl-CoA dihydrolase [Dehalococcoidia bacterium]|nr:2,3-epoxybenzoyl-CoA dihydrolase [Dehalococcoidia bacterium]
MTTTTSSGTAPIAFETRPERYRHWSLAIDGDSAQLTLAVERFGGLDPTIELKGNSYDLSVDIELHDAVQRLRFEHPEVRAVVIASADDRIFCSGANIHALSRATHAHKVNFCKFTNETRLYIEEASAESGQRYIAACNGATAGGGYELAAACDEIVFVDDNASAVSLPEVPLLAVLPGTGGLTRVIDKRRVRPDFADRFATMAEGVKGKRARDWGLVDTLAPRSRFAEVVAERVATARAAANEAFRGPGIALDALDPIVTETQVAYRHVKLDLDHARRVVEITVSGPTAGQPHDAVAALGAAADWWPLRMARELDDALLRLRFNEPQIGLLLLRTRGDPDLAHACGELLAANPRSWFVRETRLLLGRVLRRLDLTARSVFAIVDEGSSFAGPLFELLLAADRVYVLDANGVAARPGSLSGGALPRWNGLSRLATRFLGDPARVAAVRDAGRAGSLSARQLDDLGLATELIDAIDFEDDLRVAVEERASLSPDALTGMEASLRFGGPETLATKIFGRLSAWQNWIFTRPNATGPAGALSLYGKPERPRFDYTRT